MVATPGVAPGGAVGVFVSDGVGVGVIDGVGVGVGNKFINVPSMLFAGSGWLGLSVRRGVGDADGLAASPGPEGR